MGIRSTLRSRMISTGLDVGVPPIEGFCRACGEKRLSLELRMWSRSLRSSLVAIISAAAPLGQRICWAQESVNANRRSAAVTRSELHIQLVSLLQHC